MTIEYRFVPLEKWPGDRTHVRSMTRFRASWTDTATLLDRELQHLSAKNVVIQADCDRDQIRLDGFLRSDAKLRGPGVVLSFDSKHGQLSYPCDTYTDYKANIRAIALALEALRAVDRYGVTRQAEQYKGWAKLAGPGGPFSDARAAAMWMTSVGGIATNNILGSAEEFRATYRDIAAKLHPDRNNGDDTGFKRLQAAKEILDRHHGI